MHAHTIAHHYQELDRVGDEIAELSAHLYHDLPANPSASSTAARPLSPTGGKGRVRGPGNAPKWSHTLNGV